MKALLQLNLNSPFNKNYYRTRKNKLEITKEPLHTEYTFDNICYSHEDINSSIAYDIVIDYSEKSKFMGSTKSAASINISQGPALGHWVDPIQSQFRSSLISATVLQDMKEPDFSYTVLFDQIQDNMSIEKLIKDLSNTEIFKKEKIKIGHFLAHQNGVYDFHRKKVFLSDTERQQLDRQYTKLHGSIQDNFMWIYNKEINLVEEVKLNNIPHLIKSLAYISAEEFNSLSQPTLGVQLASNITKAQQIKHKELQNKKILQIFIISIGSKIRIVLILLNYNKNYSLNAEEQRELSQLLMMHGVVAGEIKYQTIKVEILNKLMKNSEKLYYVMYFPGPRLSICPAKHKNSITSSKNNSMILRERSNFSGFGKMQNSNANLLSSKISQHSKAQSPEKIDHVQEQLTNLFKNYTALKVKDRDSLQKIIKEYLVKKQGNLKGELQKIKERVKELKLNQRIEECQVADLKTKCTKALEKMSHSIIQLQRMGINNVERHMEWLKLMVDDKRQQIKEIEETIEDINKKTIENKMSHEYFYAKMVQYKDKLKKKYQQITKTGLNQNQTSTPKENCHSHHGSYINQLSLSQLQTLEQHKQKLRGKLVERLKNSEEKRHFLEGLSEIRSKVSKLQLTRLEQKYFDLLHN